MTPKLLIIPDAHAEPNYDNDRFTWLGNLIFEEKPDVVVCLGDWFDMASLSSHDKGKKSFEGRRYKQDVAVGVDAFEKTWAPTFKWNKQRSKNHKAQYNPERIFLYGNHEARLDKTVQLQPELEGAISYDDYQVSKYWTRAYPFKAIAQVEGICFCHYFPAGVLGKPIGGDNSAANLINKLHQSCVAGHSHIQDVSVRTAADGKKILGIVAGCYTHPESHGDWNFNTYKMWYRGVTMLYDVHDGFAEGIEFVTQDRIKRLYA